MKKKHRKVDIWAPKLYFFRDLFGSFSGEKCEKMSLAGVSPEKNDKNPQSKIYDNIAKRIISKVYKIKNTAPKIIFD